MKKIFVVLFVVSSIIMTVVLGDPVASAKSWRDYYRDDREFHRRNHEHWDYRHGYGYGGD